MSQSEIQELLRSHSDRWYSPQEISDILKCNIGSIQVNLKKLRRSNLVQYSDKAWCKPRMYIHKESVTTDKPE